MAWKNPFSREGNHSGRLLHWLEGDGEAGRSRVDEAEARMNGKGDEDPRERWF